MTKSQSPVQHWLGQRLSAVLLVPLSVWLIVTLALAPARTAADWSAWLADPLHNILLAVTFLASLYHSKLGLDSIIVDYMASPLWRSVLLMTITALFILLALVTLLALMVVMARGA